MESKESETSTSENEFVAPLKRHRLPRVSSFSMPRNFSSMVPFAFVARKTSLFT